MMPVPDTHVARRRGSRLRTLASVCLWGVAAMLAACGGSSSSQSIVNPITTATLKTIAVDPRVHSLPLGLSTQFTATGVYSDGSQQDLSASVTWTSSNAAVASISNAGGLNGTTTALATGTSTVTAALKGISGTATLTVTAAELQIIAVEPPAFTVARGNTQQFTATGVYSDESTQDLTRSVTWSSSNLNVASISNAAGTYGVATAVAPGKATITAALATLSGSTALTVAASSLTSITVAPANSSLAVGQTVQFVATGNYSDGTRQVLTAGVVWTSSAPATATTSAAGLVTAVHTGGTVITATLGAVSGSTGLAVAAPATPTLVSITVTPTSATIPARGTQAFVATGTYSDGTTPVITTSVAWNSSAPAIATISNAAGLNGVATGVAVGTTQITASFGGATSAPVTLTVTAALEFAYAANFHANTISEYSVGTANSAAPGALTPLATPTVDTDAEPFALAVDPSSRYLYAIDFQSGTLNQYTIGADGQLAAMPNPTLPTGVGPNGITVDPNGQFVYVANFTDATVSQYTVGTGGQLTALGTPVAAGAGAATITIDPKAQYAYVANYTDGNLSQYTIGANGVLAPLAVPTVAAGTEPNAVAVDPSGRFAYAANSGDSTISQYTIDAATGALTPVLPAVTTGPNSKPYGVTIDPTGTYVYATDSAGSSVLQFQIEAGGTLLQVGVVSTGTGTGPQMAAVDPTGQFLYTADRTTGTVSQFSIAAGTGVLTPLVPPGVPAQTGTASVIAAY